MLIVHRLGLKTEELTLRALTVKKHHIHYTDLEKKVTATCYSFATTNTFKRQLRYLLDNTYVQRVARGVYQITSKGRDYLALLT